MESYVEMIVRIVELMKVSTNLMVVTMATKTVET